MKIIEAADVDNWSRQVICLSCKSKLEIIEEDLQYSQYEYAGGSMDQFHYICPICKYHNRVLKILNVFKERVKQKYLQSNQSKSWFKKLGW